MKLRIWHIPQVPMSDPFHVEVPDIETAKLVLRTLWSYDSYQYENDIKPDYSNASGLQSFNEDSGEWEEWSSEYGESIDDIIDEEEDREDAAE